MSIIGLKEKQISELVDPFNNDCVIKMVTNCWKSDYGFGWKYGGWIEFRNGKTDGKQNFEADNFANLIRKMEKFLEELNHV